MNAKDAMFEFNKIPFIQNLTEIKSTDDEKYSETNVFAAENTQTSLNSIFVYPFQGPTNACKDEYHVFWVCVWNFASDYY